MFASADYERKRHKLEKLKEKIRQSEMERRHLERKFDEIMIEQEGCKRKSMKHIKSKYENFMREDERRTERNDNLLRMLDRVDSQANQIATKTERLKLLKNQYELYLLRNLTSPSAPPLQASIPFVPPAEVAFTKTPQTPPSQQQYQSNIHTSSAHLSEEDHFKSDFVKCLADMNRFHYGEASRDSYLPTATNQLGTATAPSQQQHVQFNWPDQQHSDAQQIDDAITHKVVFDVPAKAFTLPVDDTARQLAIRERVPNILISLPHVDQPTANAFNEAPAISKIQSASNVTKYLSENVDNFVAAPSPLAEQAAPRRSLNNDTPTVASSVVGSIVNNAAQLAQNDDVLSKAFAVGCNVTSKNENGSTTEDAPATTLHNVPVAAENVAGADKRNADTRDVREPFNAQEATENVNIFEAEYDKEVTSKLNNENGKKNDIVFEEHENSVPPPDVSEQQQHSPGDDNNSFANGVEHVARQEAAENVTRIDGVGGVESVKRISNEEADTAQFTEDIDNNTTSFDYGVTLPGSGTGVINADDGVVAVDKESVHNVTSEPSGIMDYGNEIEGQQFEANANYDAAAVAADYTQPTDFQQHPQYYQENQEYSAAAYQDPNQQQFYAEGQSNDLQYSDVRQDLLNPDGSTVVENTIGDQQYDPNQQFYTEGDQQYAEAPYNQSTDQYPADGYQYQNEYGQEQPNQMAYTGNDANYDNYDPNAQQQYDANYYPQHQPEYQADSQQLYAETGQPQAQQFVEGQQYGDYQETAQEMPQYDVNNTLSADTSYPAPETNNIPENANVPEQPNNPSDEQVEQVEAGGGETRSETVKAVDPTSAAAINYLESETDDTVSQQVKSSNNESDFDFSNN